MRKSRSVVALFVLFLLAAPGVFARDPSASAGGQVALLALTGPINRVSERYVDQGIVRAERDRAALIVIRLNSPGGQIAPTSRIVEAIAASRVPVAVYVAPAGAQASSAGLFLGMAAEIFAMAPGTSIGAASGGLRGGAPVSDPSAEAKAVAAASTTLRALADLRGRNASRAGEALTRGLALPVREAVAEHVADLEAASLGALLRSIDGRTVALPEGRAILHTAGLRVVEYPMGTLQLLLSTLADPNIAYILFLLGVIGLIFEIHAPGVGLPGVLGTLSLAASILAFSLLSINLGGALVILIALALFVVEIKVPTHGILTVGGIASLLVGSFLLFPPWRPTALPGWSGGVLSPITIVVMTVVLGLFFTGIVAFGVRAQHRRVAVGGDALVGQYGTAVSALAPNGIVKLHGEEWSATAAGDDVAEGEEVQVLSVEGVHLVVMKRYL